MSENESVRLRAIGAQRLLWEIKYFPKFMLTLKPFMYVYVAIYAIWIKQLLIFYREASKLHGEINLKHTN